MSRTVRARRLPAVTPPEPESDRSILEAYLEDASGGRPGWASGLLRPGDEVEAAAWLRATAGHGVRLLPQAARSSLTGGAVPRGEVVVSVERMVHLGSPRPHATGATVQVGPGVRLKDLQQELARRGFYYPPVPTYQEAMLGGTVSTNAGGAATFKYGVTRDWVRGLRVLLFNGDLLVLRRGQTIARPGESFRIELCDGRCLEVPVPSYRLPPLKKVSAGYHAADPLDLIDLFIGSEGTLGLITEVRVDLVPVPAAQLTGLAFADRQERGLALGRALRSASLAARAGQDPLGPDVRAIEYMDEKSLALLREHGDARRLRVRIPRGARAALLFELELAEPATNDDVQDVLARFLDGRAADGSLPRLFRALAEHDALDHVELAFPEDEARAGALLEFREAVPRRVNEILAERRRAAPEVKKVGGDLIVPVGELEAMIDLCQSGLRRRGLDFAIWGHLSDGNLHPNVLARDADEVGRGIDALLEFAEEAARRGGCPLSEHGVGRNPVKQEMLRRFLGEPAIAAMRAVRLALDPESRFAPGILFDADPPASRVS